MSRSTLDAAADLVSRADSRDNRRENLTWIMVSPMRV
jgi:hypothetical protein